MKTKIVSLLGLFFILGAAQTGSGIELVNKEEVAINLHGRLQTYGFSTYVEDDFRDHLRLYLFVKQARISFDGHVNGIKYDIEMAQGGEEGLKTTAGAVGNTSQGLLDFSADVPLFSSAYLKVGQYKVPYGLERLSDSGYLMFADRSIQHLAFNAGRDVGVALCDNSDKFAYTFGLYTGGGRDNPIRNIPLRLGSPMVSFRAGLKSGINEDMFDPKQVDVEELKEGFGVFANAFYLKDSRVGHSTVLNVKAVEKSLLTNANWNPYIEMKDVTGGSNYFLGDFWQAGGDIAYRAKAGPGLFSAEFEANYGLFKNDAGNVQATGGRLQFGFYKKPWGVALRYAFLVPDDKFAKAGTKIVTNRDPIHEITPALTLFHKKYFKIVLDAPLLVDVPVVVENKLGYYVLTEQPDQTGSGFIKRQVVPSGRLLMQLAF